MMRDWKHYPRTLRRLIGTVRSAQKDEQIVDLTLRGMPWRGRSRPKGTDERQARQRYLAAQQGWVLALSQLVMWAGEE